MPVNNQSSSLFNSKPRTYLFGGVVLLILLAVVVGATLLAQRYQQAEERAYTTAANIAISLENSLDNTLDVIDISLQAAVDEMERELASGKTDAGSLTAALLKHQIRLNHGDVQIRATNEVGDILYGTGVVSPPVNVADRQRFIVHKDKPNVGFFIDEPVFARIDKEWIWVFTRRFHQPGGAFGGIVYGLMPVNSINKNLKAYKLDAGNVISLRDKHMRLITRYVAPDKFTTPDQDKGASESLMNALKTGLQDGSYISADSKLDGQSRIHVFHKNAEFGFVVKVGIAHTTVFAEWRRDVYYSAALLFAFSCALLLSARLVNNAWKRQERSLAALEASEQSLKDAQRIARVGHYVFDLHADVWTSSAMLDEIFGIGSDYPRTASGWLDLVVAESREEMQDYLNHVIESRLPFDYDYCIMRPADGQRRCLSHKGTLQFDADGAPHILVGAIQDISERKQAERALQESFGSLQSILATTLDGFLCTDTQGKLLDVNQVYSQQSGYTREELLGMHAAELDAMYNQSEIESHIKYVSKHGAEQLETQHRRKDGSVWDVEISTTYRYFAGGRIFVFARDISERKLQQQKLEQLATRDELTGLVNRRYFYELADAAIKRALRFQQPLSISMVDIDRFKLINDTHGHAAGDVVLKSFSDTMLKGIREIDVFARLGGDEFVLLLPGASPEHAYEVIERVRLTLNSHRIELADTSVSITLSAGIACMGGEGDTLEMIMQRADQALYQSKESGRNRISVA